MALTDSESFGQVAAPQQVENVLVEKDANSYEEAIKLINQRLDFWVKEAKNDQDFSAYVSGLKNSILENQDEIERNAAIYSGAEPEGQIRPTKVFDLDEFKSEGSSEAIFIHIQTKLKHWFDSIENGYLRDTIRSVQKFMHENKDILGASIAKTLVEAQKTEQPYTNGTAEKTLPTEVHSADASDGTDTSKTLGGAPSDKSTLPQANVEEEKKEETIVAAIVTDEKPIETSSPTPSGKSPYRKGEKKDFIWYKDEHSKAPIEVKREQGVNASGITEFKPTQAKMEMDNPVPREQGVEESKITEFKPTQAKMDVDNPVPRDEGVADSGITEYIKIEESKTAQFKSNLRAVLRAIKESHEI